MNDPGSCDPGSFRPHLVTLLEIVADLRLFTARRLKSWQLYHGDWVVVCCHAVESDEVAPEALMDDDLLTRKSGIEANRGHQ